MEQWMNQYYKWIFAIIYAKTGSAEDALDLTQDTFITAYIKKDTLKDPARVKYWLRTIAENKAVSYLRKKGQTRGSISLNDPEGFTEIPDNSHNGEHEACRKELQELIDRMLMELPDEFRRVTVLALLCRLPQRDCAEILNIPVSTVNNRIHKAKSLLRKEFEMFMENSANVFDALLKEDISKTEKVIKYFDLVTEAINNKDFDKVEELLLKAPALAADNAEAHYHIVSKCDYCNFIENIWFKRKRESLFILAEQEFKLAEKLNFEGFIHPITGEQVVLFELYEMMANIYVHWEKYDKAIEYAKKSVALGNQSCNIEGNILMEQRKYKEAIDFFLDFVEKAEDVVLKVATLIIIANCYKKIGKDMNELEFLLKSYEFQKQYEEEAAAGGLDLAGSEYYIAKWYGDHQDVPNMLKYIKLCFEKEEEYKEWAKHKPGNFDAYNDLPEFKVLTGEGEGRISVFTPKAVKAAKEKKYGVKI